MRWFMKLLIVAGLGWGAYWFIGARAQEKLLANWLETSRAQGWIAETEQMSVTGFPNRFDTIISGLNLRGPRQNWGWQADEFRVYALSYKPNHVILSFPGEQIISNRQGSVKIQAEDLRGSVAFSANSNLTMERLRIEATALTALSNLGWDSAVQSINMALFQEAESDNRYRFGLNLQNVTIPQIYMAAVARVGQNTDVISQVLASAYVEFEREINRKVIYAGLPAWTTIEVVDTRVDWGAAELILNGNLFAARNGFIDGQLDFKVRNWQMFFAAFREMSTLSLAELAIIETALIGVSQGDDLDFSLRFANGQTYIGPISIGNAPVNPFF